LVQKAYGNEAMNQWNVFRWHSRFRDRRELLEDDERGGRPKLTWTEVNIAAVAADLIKNDRRITSRMIAESLYIPKTVVLQNLKEDYCSQDFFLLHDNAPAYIVASVYQYLTQKMLQPFITPVLSRFISTRLFSVPQVENEVIRTPLCGCCWDPRSRNRWIKEGPERGILSSFSEAVQPHKSLYICQWSLFWIKTLCVFNFKKISPKTFGPHCILSWILHLVTDFVDPAAGIYQLYSL
jgi:hypothetical protein